MMSAVCERAVTDALRYQNALLKFISANDVGLTGSHQCGFYLPKAAWRMYSPHAPRRGANHKHPVTVLWQDGRTTESCVTWYGQNTRSEYRLTRFGRDFPFLAPDNLGNLFVLIPKSRREFLGYVLDLEEDVDELQTMLGVEVLDTWGVYCAGQEQIETEDECLDRLFRQYSALVTSFPSGREFSQKTCESLVTCVSDFVARSSDEQLMRGIEAEYRLFRLVERQLCQSEICRLFSSVDDFLRTAARLMNRRKSRAGRSFENHIEQLLRQAAVPFEMRAAVDGEPDVLIPGRAQYLDDRYPTDRLFVVGLKTTCKDRWRQVLEEGRRVSRKHIITLQRGISNNQLAAMKMANVSLVVPQSLHSLFARNKPMELQTVDGFIGEIKRALG